jgi:hypothetical protein
VYTGDAAVSTINVCDLLEASEFFKLPGIEDLCVEFAQQNNATIENTLDMLALFVRLTNKKTLIDVLECSIVDQFDTFSRVDRFFDIPFDGLRHIVIRYLSST